MFGWLRRLVSGGAVPPGPGDVEPLRFAAPSMPGPVSAVARPRPVEASAPSARIIDRYVYGSRNGGDDRTARGVEYIGIMQRPLDGQTCLAVRMPGSTKQHFVEVALVVEVEIAGRVHRPAPLYESYGETAFKLRAFIKG